MFKEVILPENILKALVNIEQEIQFFNQEKAKITEAVKEISNYDALLERRSAEYDRVLINTVRQNGYDPQKVKIKDVSEGRILLEVPDEPKPEPVAVPDEPKPELVEEKKEYEDKVPAEEN